MSHIFNTWWPNIIFLLILRTSVQFHVFTERFSIADWSIKWTNIRIYWKLEYIQAKEKREWSTYSIGSLHIFIESCMINRWVSTGVLFINASIVCKIDDTLGNVNQIPKLINFIINDDSWTLIIKNGCAR